MKLARTIATALVATSIAATPVVAQAAAPRVSTDVEGENLRGGFIIPLIAVIAVILGILAAVDDDDESLPHSP